MGHFRINLSPTTLLCREGNVNLISLSFPQIGVEYVIYVYFDISLNFLKKRNHYNLNKRKGKLSLA